ncbi:transcription antitermination factor NusB [Actibacterium sp. MT2.3-13A]|uniref:RsmB/NOP family class I SAM-dependent RNA methyltransferase n=1 Tax=Actibacterium sp. MT2.3-13A TaxID=2828332 RepID=UPI001BA7FAE6|nr:transcription antitermination factor NusB [Actibacterium sp. MT2.3-13A]
MAQKVDPVRLAAVQLLHEVLEEHRPMAELTGEDGPLAGLEPSGRARAQRLALSTLRHAGRADAVLKPLLRKHPPEDVRLVLRLAVVEMLEEGAAPHGVVNAAVDLLRLHPQTGPLAGLANAVLRKVGEMPRAEWEALPPARMPGWLRGRLESRLGRAGVLALEAAHAAGAPLDLTPRDGDAEALAARVGGVALPTGSVRVAASAQVSALPGYAEGAWWVQDAAAALPARILAPRKGERIADLCAAPGGKTMQLAAAGAEVTALDISRPRLKRLEENLARTGLTAEVVAADLLSWQPAPFDAILLDAPCSATGTIRRHPDLPFAKSGKEIKPLFALQAQMLDHALGLLKPGGRLVFCTCSLLPEEGEEQLKSVLERHGDIAVDIDALDRPGIEAGWRDDLGGLRLRPDFWAARGGMDGFYIFALRKTG